MPNITIKPTPSPTKLDAPQLDFILLDGSGSMMENWWPMLKAIDIYVAGLKAASTDTHIVLDVFDDNDLQLTQRNTHISSWKTFDIDPIGAHWGGTPLYDAIFMMGKRIRDLAPSSGCAITIVTDGGEAGSKFATLTQAKAVLDWCRAQGWQVTFIGCDFDNSRQAKALGATPATSIGVRKELLTDATRAYARKRAAHAAGASDISFTEDERQKFGGYLNAPPTGK